MKADINDTITLAGKEIEVKKCCLPQRELKFFSENPRIYSIVYAGDETPSQAEIQEKLIQYDHVKQLVQSIKANGGLLDPLLVRDGDYVVLEGNSRLAAYRLLAEKDPIRWGNVKCYLLPKDINEKMVFALLGEYHIVGRKDWAPYEQAGYLWRHHKKHGVTIEQIATEMGLSVRKVGALIEIFSFMVEHDDVDVQRWSYYEEYLKSRAIAKIRNNVKDFDKIVVTKIKSGEIDKAVDIREKLVKITEVGGKVLSGFVEGKKDFEESYDRAISKGAENTSYRRLHKFREWISDPDTKDDFEDMNEEQILKCKYELRKIHADTERLLKDDIFENK